MSLILRTEDDYEDLLGQWSDLEASLGVILAYPNSAQEFEARLYQYGRWMQDLIAHDAHLALYLLFQLAIQSPVGYSASHALVCAVLCHLIGPELALNQHECNSLELAAFTMNIAMTHMQDQLATQVEKPSHEQQVAIHTHATKSALVLRELGIHNELWMSTVDLHHKEGLSQANLHQLTPPHRLALVLQVVDRYAAMISPRQSREGRSATESAQSIVGGENSNNHLVGKTLVRLVGQYPPGTFVQLDDDKVAVVIQHSQHSNLPDVAIVLNSRGQKVNPPTLHHTFEGSPRIKKALPAAAVQEHINHHLILQLGVR
ncbi:hypothetical protein MIZ03_2992 [Rhodoferax lithotrophicus]|uniref:Phosphodiesterase n=1 Tax=Rhodoferax lithotrophicus TaxID=2798804 RepID=A0ABN6DB81_9BURK|nr:phosphodiesterase [Rhodoferax sp. MIZ03]BCO28096.1 hypothetical protein MIZ03_2992 [Rhodoferax sp. MIZ03]